MPSASQRESRSPSTHHSATGAVSASQPSSVAPPTFISQNSAVVR